MLLACGLLLSVLAGARSLLMLGWIERSLLYFPSQVVAYPLAAFGTGAEEVWFGEHARLQGVFVPGPPERQGDQTTVVYSHGNGGNLTHRAPFVAQLQRELGVSVFIFDYQGYGQSTGTPSEQALTADAQAAIRYLGSRSDVQPGRVIYFGESLGGAVAIHLATSRPPRGLIVQSSFTSIAAMTRLHYPWLAPLLPHATTRYDSLTAVASVRSPILLIHGDSDSLVPPGESEQLRAAAGGLTQLVLVPGAGHNDVFSRGGAELWRALRSFLDVLTPA